MAATRLFISFIVVLWFTYRGRLGFPDSLPFKYVPLAPTTLGESPLVSWECPRRGEFIMKLESPLPLTSRSLVYWLRPTRPPRRAGGRPDFRVDGREGAGSGAGAVVSGLGCGGSGFVATVFVGETTSWSESAPLQALASQT